MASRKIEVQIVGDTKSLEKAFGSASKSANSFGSTMKKVGKFAAIGLGVGLAGVAVGLKKSVEAALEAEKAQARLDEAFQATTATAQQRVDAMDKVAQTSARAALDDEDLMDTLSRLTRVTGDVTKAQTGMSVAADIARGRGIALEAATKIVEKAYLGNVGALKRIGIEIPKVTTAQDALKASHEKVTTAQMAAAKAADDAATRQAAIAALQTKYAGASERYGQTAAGAQERFQVAVENLQEAIGAKLLPQLTRFLTFITANMPAIERAVTTAFQKIDAAIKFLQPGFAAVGKAIQTVAAAARKYWPEVQKAAEMVVAWYRANLLPAIQNVVKAVTAVWNKFGADLTRIAKTAFGTISAVVKNGLAIIQAVVTGVLALIRGDWQKAWESLKTVVTRVLGSIGAIVKGFASIAYSAAVAIGRALIDGIIAGASGLASRLKDAVSSQISSAISGIKGKFGIRSPSEVTAREIGKPLAQGVVEGMDGGLALLAPKMQAKIKAAVERSAKVIEASRSRFTAAFSTLNDKLLRAFDAQTGGNKTPAEAAIDAINEARTQADLQRNLAEAQAGGDAAAIARAQEDIQLNSLQKQAAIERQAYEDQREAQRERLEARLQTISKHFEKEGTTIQTALKKINKLMRDFGITFAASGALVGTEFVKGLIGAIGGAAAAGAGVRGAQTGGNPRPDAPGANIVTQVVLDGKVVAESVRRNNVVYQTANAGVRAI